MTSFEDRPADWLTLEEARIRVLGAVRPGPHEMMSPPLAAGRALARDLTAPVTLPSLPSSAMDGYAVAGGDVRGAGPTHPVRLKVIGVLRPGALPHLHPSAGEAVRIFTGGPVPPGADSVIRVEDTDREAEAGWVRILSDRDAGRHVRPAGEDVKEGEVVLEAGVPVDAGSLALMGGLGVATIAIHPEPLVAILSTGDELVPAFAPFPRGGPPAPIYDSNGPALAQAVRAAGGKPLPLRIVPDDPDRLRSAFHDAAGTADLLIVTGGASMGEADLVKRVLDGMGFRLDFWRVSIRPGSPFGFGYLPREGRPPLPIAGLPGNPASALVTFELLVRPLVRGLGGHTRRHRVLLDARAGESLPGAGRLTHLVRVTLHREGDGWVARLAGPQRSNLLAPLARAHGIAEVHPSNGGEGGIQAGDPVVVHLLTPDT